MTHGARRRAFLLVLAASVLIAAWSTAATAATEPSLDDGLSGSVILVA